MGAIDIGSLAVDRNSHMAAGTTALDGHNKANDTGTLTTYKVWFLLTATGVKVGTFYGSSVNYRSRDVHTIGDVTPGSEQTFSGLDIDVVTGDLAGFYAATGTIENEVVGGSAMGYWKVGDWFGTGVQVYSQGANQQLSLYGTGATPVSAPTVTTQAVTDIGFD